MLQNAKASDRLAIQHSLAHSHERFHDTLKQGKAIVDAPRPKVSLAKSVREEVNPSTTRADRGALVIRKVRRADGSLQVVATKTGRTHAGDIIDASEAVTMYNPKKSEEAEEKREKHEEPKGAKADLTADSRKRLEKDPLASKEKIKLPLTVGNKSAGGEDAVYGAGKYSVAEEKTLNSLYDNLSEENKEIFNNLLQTDEGIEKLLSFAREQGY
jgi:hypothetical protein